MTSLEFTDCMKEYLEKAIMTEEDATKLLDSVSSSVGYVLDRYGRGGSGVLVRNSAGDAALLTAAHVVVPAVMSGELTVLLNDGGKARSSEPKSIRVSSKCDAALILLDKAPLHGTFVEWHPGNSPDVKPGEPVLVMGFPGSWKAGVDADARQIASAKRLEYWTAVTAVTDTQLLCDVDESNTCLPTTFGGISGGPVFNMKGELVALNEAECRGKVDGRIYLVPRRALSSLFFPFCPGENAPKDHVRERLAVWFPIRHRRSGLRAQAHFLGETFLSQSSPTDPFGSMGRVVAISFANSSDAYRFPLNTESVFPIDSNDFLADSRSELRYEALDLLARLDCVLED